MRLIDAFADAFKRLYETDKFVVQLAAFVRNRQCVLILLFVAPNIRHRPQSRQQRTGADQHNPFVETLLKQARVILQRQQIGWFDRDKHKDEIQCVHTFQIGVILQRQAFHVRTDAGNVCRQFACRRIRI